MFDVSAQVLVQLGLQVSQFLLCLPGVLLQLQTGLPGVVVSSSERPAVTHLVTCAARTRTSHTPPDSSYTQSAILTALS